MLYKLTYVSHATKPFSKQEFEALARFAKHNNESQQISGALLEVDGLFIQTLEGNRTAVERLYRIIENDKRHSQATIVRSTMASSRTFTHWAMGCFRLPPAQAPRDIFMRDSLGRLRAKPESLAKIDALFDRFYREHRIAGGSQCFEELTAA